MNFCCLIISVFQSLEMFQHELLLLKMSVFQSLEMFQHELLLLKMGAFPESGDVST